MSDKEFTVIYLSAEEKDFHKIVYSSSNLFKWVGYKNKELQGADLDILLPPAIRRVHKTIISEEHISGTMLMNNKLRRLACQTKDGYLAPFSFGVRINNQLSSGVQYVGVLNFKLRARDCCVLLTNKKGEIQGLTQSALQFFQKGECIFNYNQSFKSIYRDLNLVSKEKLIMRDKGKDYSLLFSNEKRMKYWKTFCSWAGWRDINMLTKDKKAVTMRISIEDYLVYNIREYFRFVIIKKTDEQTFGDFSVNLDIIEDEEKNLKMIFDYFECENLLNEKLLERIGELDEELNHGSQWRPSHNLGTKIGIDHGFFLRKKNTKKLSQIAEQYYDMDSIQDDESNILQETSYRGIRQFLTHRNSKSSRNLRKRVTQNSEKTGSQSHTQSHSRIQNHTDRVVYMDKDSQIVDEMKLLSEDRDNKSREISEGISDGCDLIDEKEAVTPMFREVDDAHIGTDGSQPEVIFPGKLNSNFKSEYNKNSKNGQTDRDTDKSNYLGMEEAFAWGNSKEQ